MHQNIHYTVNTPLLILKCLRFDTVELTILSNHGHPEYTCLYRFRLVTFLTHGSVEIVPYPLLCTSTALSDGYNCTVPTLCTGTAFSDG